MFTVTCLKIRICRELQVGEFLCCFRHLCTYLENANNINIQKGRKTSKNVKFHQLYVLVYNAKQPAREGPTPKTLSLLALSSYLQLRPLRQKSYLEYQTFMRDTRTTNFIFFSSMEKILLFQRSYFQNTQEKGLSMEIDCKFISNTESTYQPVLY